MSHDASSKEHRVIANSVHGGELQLAAKGRRSATKALNPDLRVGAGDFNHSDEEGAAKGDAEQQDQHLVYGSLNITLLEPKQNADDMETHVKAQTKTPPTVLSVDTVPGRGRTLQMAIVSLRGRGTRRLIELHRLEAMLDHPTTNTSNPASSGLCPEPETRTLDTGSTQFPL